MADAFFEYCFMQFASVSIPEPQDRGDNRCKVALKRNNDFAAIFSFNPKAQLPAGICAAKTSRHSPGLLCKRFHDPENVHVFIPGVSILSRRKFCIQEVLMHICLPASYPNAFLGLSLRSFVLYFS